MYSEEAQPIHKSGIVSQNREELSENKNSTDAVKAKKEISNSNFQNDSDQQIQAPLSGDKYSQDNTKGGEENRVNRKHNVKRNAAIGAAGAVLAAVEAWDIYNNGFQAIEDMKNGNEDFEEAERKLKNLKVLRADKVFERKDWRPGTGTYDKLSYEIEEIEKKISKTKEHKDSYYRGFIGSIRALTNDLFAIGKYPSDINNKRSLANRLKYANQEEYDNFIGKVGLYRSAGPGGTFGSSDLKLNYYSRKNVIRERPVFNFSDEVSHPDVQQRLQAEILRKRSDLIKEVDKFISYLSNNSNSFVEKIEKNIDSLVGSTSEETMKMEKEEWKKQKNLRQDLVQRGIRLANTFKHELRNEGITRNDLLEWLFLDKYTDPQERELDRMMLRRWHIRWEDVKKKSISSSQPQSVESGAGIQW